jgi:hypothetical protein
MTHQQALETMAAERYLLDEMTEVEKHAFEEHFFDCNDCAQDVRVGEQIRVEVRAAGGSGLRAKDSQARTSNVVEFHKRPTWRRASTVIPWAAAAMLAVTAGYQSLVVVPGLRQAIAPQPLSPVMLREATRGTLPVVTVSPGQRFITLGIDVMNASAADVTYDLRDAGGHTILSGRTPLPPAGAPLYLLIPADELVRPGRHTLIVRDPASPGATLGEYVFDAN